MKNILLLSFLGLAILFSSCKGSKNTIGSKPNKKKGPGVHFVESETLTDVLEAAERDGKFVFVDFYTTWCLPCRVMDDEVFSDEELGDFFKENFISYKVDAEKGNGVNLATIYNVGAYPTLIFMDEKGSTVERSDGSLSYSALMQMAERAASMRPMQ